jgi:hypothetical protein
MGPATEDMGVDHSGIDVARPHQLLNALNAAPTW